MSDEDWVAMGTLDTDAEYADRFHELFDLRILG